MSVMDPAPRAALDHRRCDTEPIHVPGTIQPYGTLLALRGEDLVPVYVSANAGEHLGIAPRDLLGAPIATTLGARMDDQVRRLMADCAPDGQDPGFIRLNDGTSWDATWYRTDDLAVIELEPADGMDEGEAAETAAALLRGLRAAIDRLESETSEDDLHVAKAAEIRRLTGFDRVLIYQFHPDDHGEVIAEDRAPEAQSYMGHHFPAADIPPQARRLYMLNPVRGVADAQATPVGLVGLGGAPGTALDMTRSALRSLAPVHREYLRNMGVAASMSISLVRDERLWGLVACHNLTPRRVGARVRTACRLLAQVGAMQLVSVERRQRGLHRERLVRLHRDLVGGMSAAGSLAEGLIDPGLGVMRLVDADGLLVVVEGERASTGHTPSDADIDSVMAALARHGRDEPMARDDLTLSAASDGGLLPGALAVALPGSADDVVIWFRREQARRIAWAGDPNATLRQEPGDAPDRLRPRLSFEAWVEQVRGRSAPWTRQQIDSARSVGRALADAMLTRAQERLAHLGLHDALTGLANRLQFEGLLEGALDRAIIEDSRLAVLFVDLDRFKAVNDELGHAAGDALLRECAGRLRGAVRNGDVAARVGGDEFMVLCEGVSPEQARAVAERVTAAFTQPFSLGGQLVTVTASVGLALSRPDSDAHSLVTRADTAMYRAKRTGRRD